LDETHSFLISPDGDKYHLMKANKLTYGSLILEHEFCVVKCCTQKIAPLRLATHSIQY
jgi:hypothetical protein